MAHNLYFRNGKASMFYTGERPWHELGTKLDNPATAKEAIEAAQLDYEVVTQPIFTGNNVLISDKVATVNKANGKPLGIVSARYRIIQNIDAFNFFDVVVGEGQAIYHTAGALGKGERIWILAKLPNEIILSREDIVEKYLVLVNSHDGTMALRMYFSPIRVVCQNTLIASLKDARDGITIRHTGNINAKVEEARRILGITINYYQQFERIAKQLVDVKLNVEQAEKYYDTLIFGDKTPTDEDSKQLLNRKSDLLSLFEYGKGNRDEAVRHSLWTAYNAVTEYCDHRRTVRGMSEDPTRKVSDVLFGTGAQMKAKAYRLALETAGIKTDDNLFIA